MTRKHRTLGAGCFVLSLALLAGCAGPAPGAQRSPGDAVGPGVVGEVSEHNPLSAGAMQDPRVGRWSPASSSSAPTRIRIPSIGVDSALERLAVGGDGRLATPADYGLAGWYAGGVVPGAIGPAIIAGHVDSPTAPAVFARLGELTPGSEVLVIREDGSELAFRVTGAAQSSKSDFPTAAVYSNVPAPELRLITCAGGFDHATGHYTDNLIVFAALVG
ncbi:MAG TPA: class F sortase [Microbacterium sp.]|nr:class F sortase [Microbacterium sp.]